MTKRNIVMGLALAIFMIAGCAPPKVLFKESTTGDKLIQQYATTAASGEKGFYDYNLRVCDLGDDGQISECKDTLILENVSLSKGGL